LKGGPGRLIIRGEAIRPFIRDCIRRVRFRSGLRGLLRRQVFQRGENASEATDIRERVNNQKALLPRPARALVISRSSTAAGA
jgi:hypothetical protein